MRIQEDYEEMSEILGITSEEFLMNEAMEKYIPFHLTSKTQSSWVGKFSIPASYAPETANRDRPITFTVNISGRVARGSERQSLTVEDVWRRSGESIILKLKSSAYVTYSQDMTGMSQANFEGNIAFLIYATVLKIIKTYTDKYKPDYVSFSAYHAGLQPVYHVLCMRAEKMFGYKYANPSGGRNNHSFYVLSPEVNAKMKAYFASKNPNPEEVIA